MPYLDYAPRKIKLTIYWLTFSLYSSLIAAVLLWWFFGLPWLILAPLLFIGIFAARKLFENLLQAFYQFGLKVLKRVSIIMGCFILNIMYYGLVWPMGLLGSKIDLNKYRNTSSEWQRRDREKETRNHPSDNFIIWVFKSGNWWMLFLYPYLLILRVLRTETDKRQIPIDTYTLH